MRPTGFAGAEVEVCAMAQRVSEKCVGIVSVYGWRTPGAAGSKRDGRAGGARILTACARSSSPAGSHRCRSTCAGCSGWPSALWTVALAVVGALALTGAATGRAVWICLAGFALGFLALDWERRHRDR